MGIFRLPRAFVCAAMGSVLFAAQTLAQTLAQTAEPASNTATVGPPPPLIRLHRAHDQRKVNQDAFNWCRRWHWPKAGT